MIATIGQLKPAFMAAARPIRINRLAETEFAASGFAGCSATPEFSCSIAEGVDSGAGADKIVAKRTSFKKCQQTHSLPILYRRSYSKMGFKHDSFEGIASRRPIRGIT